MLMYMVLTGLAGACIFICTFYAIRIVSQFWNDEVVFRSSCIFALSLTGLWSISVAMLGLWL